MLDKNPKVWYDVVTKKEKGIKKMAGLTKYERLRRQYGEGAILMVHHVRNKWSNYFFRSEITALTMEQFIAALGKAENYEPIRTYYISLKEFRQDWEHAQLFHAETDQPQKDKIQWC